jgi:hypothetical protein
LGLSFLRVQILACMRIGFAPSIKERWPNHLLGLATLYRAIYGILGSYVIARLAPNRPMGHSLLAGILGLVMSSLGAAAAWNTTVGQHWYPVVLAFDGASYSLDRRKALADAVTLANRSCVAEKDHL